MLKKIAIHLAFITSIFVLIVLQQPDEFRVERTASISAPAAAIFPYLNNLRQWNEWSPWAKIDPKAKAIFEGPASGQGAIFIWSSRNDEVGEGRMTITESRINESVRYNLEFIRPMQSMSTAEFTLVPQQDQTLVTWSMFGEANFTMKAVGLFMDCDKAVGGYFEKGLNNLKAIVEPQFAS